MSGRKITLSVALGVLLLLGAWVLRVNPPTGSKWYPPCPLKAATGYYCPGCGTTRAFHALLNGRIGEALGKNSLAVLALPFLGVAASMAWWRWLNNEPHADRKLWPRLTIFLGILVLGYGVLRNLPWPPFSWLAPQ